MTSHNSELSTWHQWHSFQGPADSLGPKFYYQCFPLLPSVVILSYLLLRSQLTRCSITYEPQRQWFWNHFLHTLSFVKSIFFSHPASCAPASPSASSSSEWCTLCWQWGGITHPCFSSSGAIFAPPGFPFHIDFDAVHHFIKLTRL